MEEWKEFTVKELTKRVKVGFVGSCESDYCKSTDKDSIPMIRTTDLTNYIIHFNNEKFVTKSFHNKNVKSQLHKHDLLIARHGDNGKTCIYESDNEANCLNVIIIEPDNTKADYKFLKYTFDSPRVKNTLSGTLVGSVQPVLNTKTVENLLIKIPPLPTQQKIAQILSSLDDKIELNNKINANLEQQIEALLMDYISSENSTSVKLGDYLYIKGRIGWKGLKKEEYLKESRYRIINGETLTKSGIDWNKAGYISEERYSESPEIMLQVGDILLSKDGTIGKLGYVDTLELPTSVASGIFVIRNNNPEVISTVFIYFLLKSKFFNSFIAARTEGSVIPHLYQKDFMDFEFSLPTAEKMQEFNSITSPMFEQINTNLSENKKLSNLRDTLLPKLMNGEIEV